MKEIIKEKIPALVLILIAGLIAGYFYYRGEVSFLPSKEKKTETVVEIPFTEKKYALSYKEKDTDTVRELGRFEENEKWLGDGEFDYANFFEGESSLMLISKNHEKVVASRELSQGMDIKDTVNFKFLIYVSGESADIEEFNLLLAGKNGFYKYPLREFSQGWNLLVLPKSKFSWVGEKNKQEDIIQKITFELISRPKARTKVNLDFLWGEQEEIYENDWLSNSERFLSLGKQDGKTALLAINLSGSLATVKKISSAKNYSLQAKFRPLKTGEFGFFLRGNYKTGYGYYLTMNGIKSDDWKIYKTGIFDGKGQTIVLAEGKVNNLQIEKNKDYWLKAEISGPKIIFYLSLDGKNFIKMGEASDRSFSSGGVGINTSGGTMLLIDEILFLQ